MSLLSQKAILTGTQVNYYVICPTKLWLFSHFATMEQTSNLVILGRLLHEVSYPQFRKDLLIDQKISIDFIRKGNKLILSEVKKSERLEKAHIVQMLYYIYYLKHQKGVKNVEGQINYPTKRKIIRVELTSEKETELKNILQKIKQIISLPKPPKPKRKRYCRKCAYFEFCFAD